MARIVKLAFMDDSEADAFVEEVVRTREVVRQDGSPFDCDVEIAGSYQDPHYEFEDYNTYTKKAPR